MLNELSAVFQWLWLYRGLPRDRLRVFSTSSREEMHEQLMRENNGLRSNSVLAAQFLQERGICLDQEGHEAADQREPGSGGSQEKVNHAVITHPSTNQRKGAYALDERSLSAYERRWEEFERGGGDHDSSYTFTLPTSTPQVLAWVKLMARVQQGELQP